MQHEMVHEIVKTTRTRSNTTKTSEIESESISNLIIRNEYYPFNIPLEIPPKHISVEIAPLMKFHRELKHC